MQEVAQLQFKIEGSLITKFAREKCYLEHNIDFALDFLESCMVTDQLTEKEIHNQAIAILDGRAELRGTYPDASYGYYELETPDKRYRLENYIREEWRQKEQARKEKEALERESKRQELLDSFLSRYRNKIEKEEDYGWLRPDGVFFGVEWGEHQAWANQYMLRNMSEEEYDKTDIDFLYSGDYLLDRGWVLLHNPAQGVAYPTVSDTRSLTKKQREFLYDYYIKRNQTALANKYIKE